MSVVLGWSSVSAVRSGLCVAVGVLLLALSLASVAWAAPGDTILVSRASGRFGARAGIGAVEPSISADGRRVAFAAGRGNRIENPTSDVFVRDLRSGTATLVSRASGPAGANANAHSNFPSISADGRFVVFDSDAANLARGNRNHKRQVFVRDLRLGTTTLVSRASGPTGAVGNADSLAPTAISADGRFVAFPSAASNLARGDHDRRADVFVRDLRLKTTTLVSRGSGPPGAVGTADAFHPSMSADGRFVAFAFGNAATAPLPPLHPSQDVFVEDLRLGTATLVSRASGPDGAEGDNFSQSPAMSADGRVVAFVSDASNLTADVRPSFHGQDVFVRDLAAATTTLTSRASGAAGAIGNSGARDPSISANGRFVAFDTEDSNLTADDPNQDGDVYVRDRVSGTTTLVSRASGIAGAKANNYSYYPSISADGRVVAFESAATNLSPNDHNNHPDVYVRDLGPTT